ncbi:MAG: NAD-dependent DNA ligase LigA [Acidobacteriota bacterium]
MSGRAPASREAAAARAEALRRDIWRHRKRYYVDADPLISDGEYDALEAELREIERRFPELVVEDSPTQRVGAAVTGELPTVPHAVPMLSLENVTTSEELGEWHDRLRRLLGRDRVPLVAELKIDGVSVSLIYEGGRLVRAVSRGDGLQGEEVTASVRTIRSVPLRLLEPVPFLEARGEVYYPIAAFEEMNRRREEAGEPAFANPRNAAAGTIRLLDPGLVSGRPLALYAWGLVRIEGAPPPRSHAEGLRRLAGLGLRVNPATRTCRDLDEVEAFYREWRERRDELDYEVDGCVVKLDPVDLQRRAGSTARAPRWACAYKFPPRQATTVVREIVVQVGRTGALTPVAVLEPVRLGGSTISRCTLHNEEEVRRKDVRVADRVLIEKGGDVIPRVVKVVPEARPDGTRPYAMPRHCPACGSRVLRPEGEVIARCLNASCPARLKESIRHFARREAMDIEGLGEALVDQLICRGMIREIPDIYRLDPGSLAGLERMGRKSAANLLEQIERSKSVPFERLVFALGIRFVGERTARLLADAFPSMERLAAATVEELTAVREIGDRVADEVRRFFEQPENGDMVRRLAGAGLTMRATGRSAPAGGALAGKTVVITGVFPGRSRPALRGELRRRGARVTESVSGKTDLLIAGDDPGSKLDRARALGVRVIGARELRRLLDDRPGEERDG